MSRWFSRDFNVLQRTIRSEVMDHITIPTMDHMDHTHYAQHTNHHYHQYERAHKSYKVMLARRHGLVMARWLRTVGDQIR